MSQAEHDELGAPAPRQKGLSEQYLILLPSVAVFGGAEVSSPFISHEDWRQLLNLFRITERCYNPRVRR